MILLKTVHNLCVLLFFLFSFYFKAFGGSPSPLAPSPHPGGITPPVGTTSQHLIPPPPMGVAIPPGAHQPSPIRPRIPSPQELVKHTQNILQQALIKRQLEVQREKFYARERETR